MSMEQIGPVATGQSDLAPAKPETALMRAFGRRNWLVRLSLRIARWVSADFELRTDRPEPPPD